MHYQEPTRFVRLSCSINYLFYILKVLHRYCKITLQLYNYAPDITKYYHTHAHTLDRPLNTPAIYGNCPPSNAMTSPVIQFE